MIRSLGLSFTLLVACIVGFTDLSATVQQPGSDCGDEPPAECLCTATPHTSSGIGMNGVLASVAHTCPGGCPYQTASAQITVERSCFGQCNGGSECYTDNCNWTYKLTVTLDAFQSGDTPIHEICHRGVCITVNSLDPITKTLTLDLPCNDLEDMLLVFKDDCECQLFVLDMQDFKCSDCSGVQ